MGESDKGMISPIKLYKLSWSANSLRIDAFPGDHIYLDTLIRGVLFKVVHDHGEICRPLDSRAVPQQYRGNGNTYRHQVPSKEDTPGQQVSVTACLTWR